MNILPDLHTRLRAALTKIHDTVTAEQQQHKKTVADLNAKINALETRNKSLEDEVKMLHSAREKDAQTARDVLADLQTMIKEKN